MADTKLMVLRDYWPVGAVSLTASGHRYAYTIATLWTHIVNKHIEAEGPGDPEISTVVLNMRQDLRKGSTYLTLIHELLPDIADKDYDNSEAYNLYRKISTDLIRKPLQIGEAYRVGRTEYYSDRTRRPEQSSIIKSLYHDNMARSRQFYERKKNFQRLEMLNKLATIDTEWPYFLVQPDHEKYTGLRDYSHNYKPLVADEDGKVINKPLTREEAPKNQLKLHIQSDDTMWDGFAAQEIY